MVETKEKEKSPTTKKVTASKGEKVPKKKSLDHQAKKIKELKNSLVELEDRHLRLKAEFDNYRKRKEREIIRLLEYEGEEVIKSFLPVIDDLERMLESVNGETVENVSSISDGMKMILEKLKKRLKELGVEPFESKGSKFDPRFHDALMTQASDEHDEHEIIQEFEKGYQYKDRVIRHAKVVVSTGQQKKEKMKE